ncbi:IS3 family transposase [Spiroplasma endosymbiont of Poecilobothrus nobilitatus]|uniref:IS3 family transposase n=1 Tax=Spiroplasma endosymbiont of Poecilobothrus nobilitatus TaxID=1209220 RepID=UPI00313C9C0D
MEISYSGFYNWIKLGYSKFNKWDKTLAWIIKLTYLFYNQKYGYRLLTKLINKMWNLNLAEHIVYRYMKNLGIKSVINKKTKFKYPESTENSKTANLLLKTNKYGKLKRNFYTTDINQVWVTDITYLLTSNKPFYLTIIRDINNDEIIDWNISSNFSNGFVFQSLKNAWVKRNKPKNVIIHSDHDIQYIKQKWNILTGQLDMWMSMSRKGNPADNGCCETWFKSYKYECLNLIPKSNRTKEVLMKVTHNYVNFYNNYRPLTKIKGMSPVEYRLHS